MNKNILITHNDLDGYMCGYLFERYGLGNEVHNINYGEVADVFNNIINNSDTSDIIYITDLCIKQEQLNILNDYNVKIFDHHIDTKILKETKNCQIRYDDKVCGSKIFYDYLAFDDHRYQDTTLNALVNEVTMWDLFFWTSKYNTLDNAPVILNSVFHYKKDEIFQIFDKLVVPGTIFPDKLVQGLIMKLKPMIQEHLDARDSEMDRLLGERKIEKILTKSGALNALIIPGGLSSISLLAYKAACEIWEPYDFIAITGLEYTSLRNPKSGLNLSVLAKEWGGGGHPFASGCKTQLFLNAKRLKIYH